MRFAAPFGVLIAVTAHAAPPPTFAHDIAPIIFQNCAGCHRPGESGPFPLLRYEDVKKHAKEIADATGRRDMPPWLPEAGFGNFLGERRLTDTQIRLIAEWVSQGAPEGNPSEIPPPPKFTNGWQLGPPDMILEAQSAHAVPASGPDVYWNFIFPIAMKSMRYVRAVEILPGNQRSVHDANLYVDRARSARRQETAGGQGFPGMDVVIDRPLSEPDDGRFLFWNPGSAPYEEPEGFAWRLDPGNDLVLNTHLRPTGKPEQVRPSIGLYFTDEAQEKFPMLVKLEPGALHIPPGNRDFLASDDFRLPMDLDVLAVYPHAPDLGRLLEGYATLPNGQRKWLIRIPDWDPNWQEVYRYRQSIFLPKGSVISMRYHYDNSSGSKQDADEMGGLWLQVSPKPDMISIGGDRRMELQEALMRHRLEKYPDDFVAHFEIAAIRMARFDEAGALPMIEAAVRIRPGDPDARNLLGSALVAVGRNTEAIEQFRAALRARADYETARYNLARALVRAGKYDEAIVDFNQLIKRFPRDAQVRDELGELYLRQGKRTEATELFNQALAIDPKDAVARRDSDPARGAPGEEPETLSVPVRK